MDNYVKRYKKGMMLKMNKTDIDLDGLKQFVEKGAILIDVRSPQEYREGHIRSEEHTSELQSR